MSDGDFNPDNMINRYRNSENLGVVFDTHTKQHVIYPSIPKAAESIPTTAVCETGTKRTIYPSKLCFKSPYKKLSKNHTSQPKKHVEISRPCKLILQCAYRLRKHPFGKEYMIDILSGKNTVKIKRHHHERLSVYGVLDGYSRAKLRELIATLIMDNFLIKRGGTRPTITLTNKGEGYLYVESTGSIM